MSDNQTQYWQFKYTINIDPDGAVWRGKHVQDVGEGETMELAMQQFAAAKQLELETELSIRGVTVFERVESISEEEYKDEFAIAREARQAETAGAVLQFDDFERNRQQLRWDRMSKQIDRQREEIKSIRTKWSPLSTTTPPRVSGVRRFLYIWIGIIGMMLLCLAIAWVGAQIASVIADHTNKWVGLVTMLALYGALIAWGMTSTPDWFKRLAVKAFDVTSSEASRRRKIS